MSDAGFQACLPTTLVYEAGLSMRHDDPGNWTGGKVGVGTLKGTNMGIAASSHPSLDIARLTKADVAAIYQREYWAPAGCDRLPVGLDLCHFDATVNSGLGRSKAWLAASTSATAVTNRIHGYSAARLHSFQSFRQWATFGKGWAARISGVEAKAIGMAAAAGQTVAPAAEIIAAKGAAAAMKAKAAGTVAHASTAIAAGGVVEAATAHPYLGALAAVLAAISAVYSAFHASTAGARAATLAQAAASA